MNYGTYYGMSTMNIRSTFALDRPTVQGLARLAARWQVSKSEALRRAVAYVDQQTSAGDEVTPHDALAWLKCHPLPQAQVDGWLAENEAARLESDRHRQQGLEETWEELAPE